MTPSAYLFDLDMTLVDSSGLRAYRDRGRWDEVRARSRLVKPFPASSGIHPHALPGLLMAKGYKVAVVTSSPRPYAERLCRMFEIAHDVLIAYHDTERHKPDPQPLEAALQRLGVRPANACHVGDDLADVEAAHHAGVLSVQAGWSLEGRPVSTSREVCSTAADLWAATPDLLAGGIDSAQHGYLGEILAAHGTPIVHQGSFLSHREGNVRHASLGRYFTTEDARAGGSVWSHRILSLKDCDDFAEFFADVLVTFLEALKRLPDVFVSVPPKRGQRNRFAPLLAEASRRLRGRVRVCPDGLACVRGVEDYKSRDSRDRAEAIKGAFEARERWAGWVVLIDDVCTSGATAAECVRVTKGAGAAAVSVLTFGLSQHPIQRKMCPSCGRPMRQRTARQTGNRFWGCTGYPKHCDHTENIDPPPSPVAPACAANDDDIPF